MDLVYFAFLSRHQYLFFGIPVGIIRVYESLQDNILHMHFLYSIFAANASSCFALSGPLSSNPNEYQSESTHPRRK